MYHVHCVGTIRSVHRTILQALLFVQSIRDFSQAHGICPMTDCAARVCLECVVMVVMFDV